MSAAERDASARGWRGLELEKASQDERAREFNLSYNLDLLKTVSSSGKSGKGDDALMSNKPIYIDASGTSLIDNEDTEGKKRVLHNAVKLEKPLANIHKHPRLQRALANVAGVNLRNYTSNSQLWDKLKSDILPYYDVYYNGDVDNIDEGSSDLILELRPKTTEVPDQESSEDRPSSRVEQRTSRKSVTKVKQTKQNNPIDDFGT